MKMAVFWDTPPCSLKEIYRRFRYTSIITLMMEEVSASETVINLNHTIMRKTIQEIWHFRNFNRITDHTVRYVIFMFNNDKTSPLPLQRPKTAENRHCLL